MARSTTWAPTSTTPAGGIGGAGGGAAGTGGGARRGGCGCDGRSRRRGGRRENERGLVGAAGPAGLAGAGAAGSGGSAGVSEPRAARLRRWCGGRRWRDGNDRSRGRGRGVGWLGRWLRLSDGRTSWLRVGPGPGRRRAHSASAPARRPHLIRYRFQVPRSKHPVVCHFRIEAHSHCPRVAVGTALHLVGSGRPPHGSQRAVLPQWALASGVGVEAFLWPGVQDTDGR